MSIKEKKKDAFGIPKSCRISWLDWILQDHQLPHAKFNKGFVKYSSINRQVNPSRAVPLFSGMPPHPSQGFQPNLADLLLEIAGRNIKAKIKTCIVLFYNINRKLMLVKTLKRNGVHPL